MRNNYLWAISVEWSCCIDPMCCPCVFLAVCPDMARNQTASRVVSSVAMPTRSTECHVAYLVAIVNRDMIRCTSHIARNVYIFIYLKDTYTAYFKIENESWDIIKYNKVCKKYICVKFKIWSNSLSQYVTIWGANPSTLGPHVISYK